MGTQAAPSFHNLLGKQWRNTGGMRLCKPVQLAA
jgi:hypothetical protein